MKTRRRNNSEDLLTVSRRNKRVNTSENGGENVLPIPTDLVFEIFSRLPVKSIAKCRCVSKKWAFMLRRTEFTELFLSKSYARPQLLFAYENGRELLVFTSPQPQNPDENSPPIIANNQMSFSFDGNCIISGLVNGLVCVLKYNQLSNGVTENIPVICNPSTGKFLPLKKVKTRRADVKSLVGYDPVEKRFKVLSMTWAPYERRGLLDEEHQVLTLGIDKWRMVEYCLPGRHGSPHIGLCINGVMYYQTFLSAGISAICCFDIRSEKFSFIKLHGLITYPTLINYNGNLGLIWPESGDDRINKIFDQTSTSLKLWILEDVERQNWSKRNIVLPPMWKYVVGKYTLDVVGVTGTNEIVFKSRLPSHPMYLFYLNTDKKTIVRVEFQLRISLYEYARLRIFMNHGENVKLF